MVTCRRSRARSPPNVAQNQRAARLDVKWLVGLRKAQAENRLINPTLFKAIIYLFPDVAQRVNDRHCDQYTVEYFHEVLEPFFERVRKADLRNPGNSHRELYDALGKALRQQFSL